MIDKFLEDFENRIDPATENDLEDQWLLFLNGKWPENVFRPRRRKASAPALEWPQIMINDALEDMELMLLRELAAESAKLGGGSGELMNIRCNFGTGCLSSLFGAEIFYMDRELNTLPTTIPLADGTEGIRKLLSEGAPEFDRGFTPNVFGVAAYYREKLKDYPKICEYVRLYHPDLQGPIDVAELLWGSAMFIEFYDNPQMVKDFLALITETYSRYMRRWDDLFPPLNDRLRSHWGLGHRGNIVLRNDSVMNLSPEIYEEFICPHDRKLLEMFGGGLVHFCGRGDHYIDILTGIPELTGIQLSQPQCNHMEKIFQHTVDRGLPLYVSKVPEASGRDLHGLVYCNDRH